MKVNLDSHGVSLYILSKYTGTYIAPSNLHLTTNLAPQKKKKENSAACKQGVVA